MKHRTTMRSERLQRLAALLRDGEWHTSAELADATGSVAVHSDVADLRTNGARVLCRLLWTDAESGRRVYGYRLTRGPRGWRGGRLRAAAASGR